MNDMKIFENSEFGAVRVVDVNGEPWFVAKDVLRALDYADDYNPSRAMQAIPGEWKGGHRMHTPGGEQEMLIISEQGLYFFLGRSDKPKALPYQMWVAGDVVPTIRRTGQYGGYALPRVPQSFPDALRMIADIEEEKQLALEQRDYYKRTKAEIGSRREATSMATASAAVRQRDALADQMGEGKHYKQVKAIPWLLEVFHESAGMYSQVGRKLSDLGARMGLSPRIKEGSQYGTVKIHHVEVIEALRLALKQDHNLLGKYRKVKAA